jgi:hypothetical protein
VQAELDLDRAGPRQSKRDGVVVVAGAGGDRVRDVLLAARGSK